MRTTRLEHAQRVPLQLTLRHPLPEPIQHHIAPQIVPRPTLPSLAALGRRRQKVVHGHDCRVRSAVLTHLLDLGGAAGGEDAAAVMPEVLRGEAADAARRAVDEHGLARRDCGEAVQRPPRGERRKGQRRGVSRRHPVRQQRRRCRAPAPLSRRGVGGRVGRAAPVSAQTVYSACAPSAVGCVAATTR